MDLTNIAYNFLLSLEFGSALAAIYYFNKYNRTSLKFILPYLILVVFVEFSSPYLSRNGVGNHWLYNILGLVEFSFIFYLYREQISNIKYKKIISITWVLFYLLFIIDLIFIQKSFLILNTTVFSIGSLCTGVMIILFFHEVLNSDKVLNLRHMLITWVSIGLLFYHIGSLPLTAVYNSLKSVMGDEGRNLLLFLFIPAIIMYLSFILGFIWSKKKHNY